MVCQRVTLQSSLVNSALSLSFCLSLHTVLISAHLLRLLYTVGTNKFTETES